MPLRRALTLPQAPCEHPLASLHLAASRCAPWTLAGSPGTAYNRKGLKNFSPGTGCPCENLGPPGFAFPLHPREPRRHASHKAPGAKEDVMEAIDTRTMRGIRVYLEHGGFEILEEGWAHGDDIADFIARDEGRPGLRLMPGHTERRRGIPRGERGPRGARTASDGLPRRAPGLRGCPGQVRRHETACRR